MRTALATKAPARQIARSLPVLVPLIQEELAAANRISLEHQRRAGELLLEAREQIAAFKWGKWLSKNFDLSRATAYRYMALAERIQQDPDIVSHGRQSARRITGRVERPQWQPVFKAANNIDVDEFKEVRQARAEEVQLHRDLALELIDIGFKALATRLHPDRGGSKDAMRRLNRVRDELKHVAATRRFE